MSGLRQTYSFIGYMVNSQYVAGIYFSCPQRHHHTTSLLNSLISRCKRRFLNGRGSSRNRCISDGGHQDLKRPCCPTSQAPTISCRSLCSHFLSSRIQRTQQLGETNSLGSRSEKGSGNRGRSKSSRDFSSSWSWGIDNERFRSLGEGRLAGEGSR
jgi:hypothetical protein